MIEISEIRGPGIRGTDCRGKSDCRGETQSEFLKEDKKIRDIIGGEGDPCGGFSRGIFLVDIDASEIILRDESFDTSDPGLS
jgi:hypothetical protein